MTPYQLSLCVEEYNERTDIEDENKLILTWLSAYFQRTEKLPSLNRILGKELPKKQMTPEQMLKQVQQLNAVFGGSTVEKPD